MTKEYHYSTNCVSANGSVIQKMVDDSVGITYDTFVRHCEGVKEWAEGMGYSRTGLTLKGDWHVSYHRSKYGRKPCYYLVHSSIEYIWLMA